MRTDGINYEIYFLFFLMKRTFYIYKLCHFRIDLILHKEFYYNNKKKSFFNHTISGTYIIF